MNHVNILVCIQTALFGGPQNQVLQLSEGLLNNGYNYIALLPLEDGNAPERLATRGIKTIQIPLHRMRKSLNIFTHINYILNFFKDIKRIRIVIRKENVQIVQVCGLLNIQAGIAAKLERKKLVWQLLSNYAPLPMRLMFSPIVYFLADSIMTTGSLIVRDHLLVGKHKLLKSFFPPVNLEKFSLPTAKEISESKIRLQVIEDNFTIGTVGNFHMQKSHDFLIEIFDRFHKMYPNSRLRILGSVTDTNKEYYEKNVVSLAKHKGLLNNNICMFLEVGKDVPDYLAGVDVFVLSSQSEGIPTVMLEAMAMGKPVISTSVGSIPEIVTEDIGFLVEYLDTDSFVERLESIYKNDQLRIAMGQNAYIKANQRFNIDTTLKDHLEIFENLS